MLEALGSESVAQASVKVLLRPIREGRQSTRLLFKGMFIEKQRKRSCVACFQNGMASLENGMFKGTGR